MIFSFVKQKIVIDAFSALPSIIETSPILETKHFFPEWWKQLPKTVDVKRADYLIETPNPTLKTCTGFIEYMKTGFIIPSWCDMKIASRSDGSWTYAMPMPHNKNPYPIIDHPSFQYGSYWEDYINIKLISPWVLTEKTGVKFYWNSPTWHQKEYWNKLTVLPATVDFKYQSATNIICFIPKKNDDYIINHGTPLVHLVPLTDKKVEIKMHEVSYEEFIKIYEKNSFNRCFSGSYKTFKNLKNKESKCPFDFN
jgi:hypothetical protein